MVDSPAVSSPPGSCDQAKSLPPEVVVKGKHLFNPETPHGLKTTAVDQAQAAKIGSQQSGGGKAMVF
jgi:hypothetical protein